VVVRGRSQDFTFGGHRSWAIWGIPLPSPLNTPLVVVVVVNIASVGQHIRCGTDSSVKLYCSWEI